MPSRLAAALAAALGLCATAAGAPALPDLVSEPPVHSHVEVRAGSGAQPARLLLRMDGFVHNVGPGPLDVSGNPSAGEVFQRVRDDVSGAFTNRRRVTLQFENSDGHNHWHLMAASEYSLWNLARTAQVAPADKIGFCLYDLEAVDPWAVAAPVYDDNVNQQFCQANRPAVTAIRMGVSAGWRDIYGSHLELQWVDVSNTIPGEYVLASRANPTGVVDEVDTANGYGFANVTSIVPGYVARPVGPVAVDPGASRQVTLAADAYSRPTEPGANVGPRRFRVTTPPTNGTLNVPSGVALTDPVVTYTPNPGYQGPDSFGYQAYDATSPFPRAPASAGVSLSVGAPAPGVTISGAPGAMVVGTSAQLTATVANAPSGVIWDVNGIAGGTATSGTITADGRYTAPSNVPPAPVTITARSVAAPVAAASVSVTILPAPPVEPLPNPSVAPPAAPRATGTIRLGTPRISGGRLRVDATASTRGVVRVQVRSGAALVMECVLPVIRNRSLTCARAAQPAWRGGRLTATAAFVDATTIAAFTRPQVEVRNGILIARTRAGRAGTVTIELTRRRRTVLRCTGRATAGRDVSCSITQPRGVTAAELRATVTHASQRGVFTGRF